MTDELKQITEVLTIGLTELRQDSAQLRQDSSQAREQSRVEIGELRKDFNELIVTLKESTVSQKFLTDEVKELRSDLHDKEFGTNARVDKLEIAASNNKLRWSTAIGIVLLVISSVGWIYSMVSKPIADSTEELKKAHISNAEMAGKLDSQNQNLSKILDTLIEEYERREESGLYGTDQSNGGGK